MLEEKLRQYSSAWNISEGAILLKYMRDFVEYGGSTLVGGQFVDDLLAQLEHGAIGAGEAEGEVIRPSRNNL